MTVSFALPLSGCGLVSNERSPGANAEDRGFVSAMLINQQEALTIARDGAEKAQRADVRRYARAFAERRARDLDLLNREEESFDIAGIAQSAPPQATGGEDALSVLGRLDGAEMPDAQLVAALDARRAAAARLARNVLTRGEDHHVRRFVKNMIRQDRKARASLRLR
jgi:uncharacterized protein (DUF305 family)